MVAGVHSDPLTPPSLAEVGGDAAGQGGPAYRFAGAAIVDDAVAGQAAGQVVVDEVGVCDGVVERCVPLRRQQVAGERHRGGASGRVHLQDGQVDLGAHRVGDLDRGGRGGDVDQ